MLSLVDLSARIASGQLTPDAAIRQSQEAIVARNGALRAIVCTDPSPCIAAEGPLAGIAVGVKDIIDTADLPTQMGSPIYEGWRPRADAAIVSRLKALGAVPLCKTVTTPFAGLDPAATRNPHDPDHTPGGSSSGSVAAVAAGLLPLALGTQTGGSVIRPAAFCGVAAIKPSFRLLPTVGVKTFSWALDTLGLFGARVADVARALALIADRPALDRGTAEGPVRIGLCHQDFAGTADRDAITALAQARIAAEQAGAQVSELYLPPAFAEAWGRHAMIQDFEARQALAWEFVHHRAALPKILGAQLERAQAIEAEGYDEARRIARRARQHLRDVFSEYDVILTFSAAGRAPHGHSSTGDPRFNRLWTLMGIPCVNLPVPGNGLPLGVQVIARFGDDGTALAVAQMIERALPR